jgi:hypothetical protein
MLKVNRRQDGLPKPLVGEKALLFVKKGRNVTERHDQQRLEPGGTLSRL